MSVRPIYDRVIIKPIKEDNVTASGLVIAASATKDTPPKGKVIAVGNGYKTENGTIVPLLVQVGDVVLYGQYAGNPIKIKGEDHIVMKEEEIYGILEDE